jgi:hypothetical protein
MPAVHRTALVKIRALVGGGAALFAEDIVRTSMKAGGRVSDPHRRTELEARLMSLLIALGMTPRSSPTRRTLRREVETMLDAIEQVSRR